MACGTHDIKSAVLKIPCTHSAQSIDLDVCAYVKSLDEIGSCALAGWTRSKEGSGAGEERCQLLTTRSHAEGPSASQAAQSTATLRGDKRPPRSSCLGEGLGVQHDEPLRHHCCSPACTYAAYFPSPVAIYENGSYQSYH